MWSRQGRNRVSYRPLWWVYVTVPAALLFVIGMCIIIVSLSSGPVKLSGGPIWSWTKVGLVLLVVGGFSPIVIEGVLLAMRHPWGAGFRMHAERHLAHPRLFGVAEVWGSLVFIGGIGVYLFVPDPLSVRPYLPLAMLLLALTPLLALLLFDRRR